MAGISAIPRVAAAEADDGIAALGKYGVLAVDEVLPRDMVDTLRDAVLHRHPEFADKALLSDFQDNGDGRFIAPVAISQEVWRSGLLQHPALAILAEGALGPDWVVDAFGFMIANPGCDTQDPHRDGPSLFPETTLGAILPAYALTVLFPLVDVGADNGATAFRPETHRYSPLHAEREPMTAQVPRGSLLAWNFETLHWGLANTSDHPRPALYMTLCRPFWTDMSNFGGTSRTRLLVDADVIPLLDRRFHRATSAGRWGHTGLGEKLRKVGRSLR